MLPMFSTAKWSGLECAYFHFSPFPVGNRIDIQLSTGRSDLPEKPFHKYSKSQSVLDPCFAVFCKFFCFSQNVSYNIQENGLFYPLQNHLQRKIFLKAAWIGHSSVSHRNSFTESNRYPYSVVNRQFRFIGKVPSQNKRKTAFS